MYESAAELDLAAVSEAMAVSLTVGFGPLCDYRVCFCGEEDGDLNIYNIDGQCIFGNNGGLGQ